MNRLPAWLLKRTPKNFFQKDIRSILAGNDIHSVCEEAKCPNRGECSQKRTMTFLILGNRCTRNCRFCGVDKGAPAPLDPEEPRKVVEAVRKLSLKHVVITSVTRDDLPDGGAGQFRTTVQLLHQELPLTTSEVLIPDFLGNEASWSHLLDLPLTVLNHNVETVPRLYPNVRPEAEYRRSLTLLAYYRKNSGYKIKSGMMLGLGETETEVQEVLRDLRTAGCSIVTLGQYLRPSLVQAEVREYITPEQFETYAAYGRALGLQVFAGPWVRSSYCAEEVLAKAVA